MSKLKTLEYISVDEYLDGKKTAQVRHEYYDGAIFAMVGASTALSKYYPNRQKQKIGLKNVGTRNL